MCEVCPHRQDGFATRNDLERHRKGVHGLVPRVGPKGGYICSECLDSQDDKAGKWWPRKDNFKNHVRNHVKKKHNLAHLSSDMEKKFVDDILRSFVPSFPFAPVRC